MELITKEQLLRTINRYDKTVLYVSKCLLCEFPLYYEFRYTHLKRQTRKYTVWFHSECNCTSIKIGPTQKSWDDVLNHFNHQTLEVRHKMWRDFIGDNEDDEEMRLFHKNRPKYSTWPEFAICKDIRDLINSNLLGRKFWKLTTTSEFHSYIVLAVDIKQAHEIAFKETNMEEFSVHVQTNRKEWAYGSECKEIQLKDIGYYNHDDYNKGND